jgi:sugar phosphate permease
MARVIEPMEPRTRVHGGQHHPVSLPRAALGRRQILTVALLFCGYAALYFARADLSVATPLLIDEMGRRGISHDAAILGIGRIASWGVVAYAFGKIFLTVLGDVWGGRPNFLIGLGGAALFTWLFTRGDTLPLFTLAWLGNRLTQSVAWAGLLKVSSKWFDFTSYGLMIGVLSVSYLVGDAVARRWMGALIEHGHGWRDLFYVAAGVCAVLFVANAWLLRESRTQVGAAETVPHPKNVYGGETRGGFKGLLRPLFSSPAFLWVCLLSLACTIVRETFNTWTPVYLRDHYAYSNSDAASASALFPAVGTVSVIATGWLSDRLGANSRAVIMALGLAATAAALLTLALLVPATAQPWMPLAAIGTTAFCLLGPYSYLGGALAIDFGGKRGAAVSSGMIDGIGYLGSVMAGDTVARMAVSIGWKGVFIALAVISLLAAGGAVALYRSVSAQGRV